MKFQDSSFNGLKVTVCTKSVTQAPTNGRSKSNMPHQVFQIWGHNNFLQFFTHTYTNRNLLMLFKINYLLIWFLSDLNSKFFDIIQITNTPWLS